jgi:hypothetical protein
MSIGTSGCGLTADVAGVAFVVVAQRYPSFKLQVDAYLLKGTLAVSEPYFV